MSLHSQRNNYFQHQIHGLVVAHWPDPWQFIYPDVTKLWSTREEYRVTAVMWPANKPKPRHQHNIVQWCKRIILDFFTFLLVWFIDKAAPGTVHTGPRSYMANKCSQYFDLLCILGSFQFNEQEILQQVSVRAAYGCQWRFFIHHNSKQANEIWDARKVRQTVNTVDRPLILIYAHFWNNSFDLSTKEHSSCALFFWNILFWILLPILFIIQGST